MPSLSQILAQSVTDAGVQATVVYATAADLPLSGNTTGTIALVTETNRLYIWNGSGWYNIALINTNPTITDGYSAEYELSKDGTPTVVALTANDPEGVPLTWSYVVTSGALGDTTVVNNGGGQFTITPGTLITPFELTFSASDGINTSTAVSSFISPTRNLWRLFNAGATVLWDNEALVDPRTGWWDGSTSVTAGTTLSTGALQPGRWNAFNTNTNPLVDSPLVSAYAVTSNGTFDPNVGGRSVWDIPSGGYIGFYFENDVPDITRIYHRTFQAGRGTRVFQSGSLQYYNGSLSSTYDENNWVTYATLNNSTYPGWAVWDNITEGSTVVGVAA